MNVASMRSPLLEDAADYEVLLVDLTGRSYSLGRGEPSSVVHEVIDLLLNYCDSEGTLLPPLTDLVRAWFFHTATDEVFWTRLANITRAARESDSLDEVVSYLRRNVSGGGADARGTASNAAEMSEINDFLALIREKGLVPPQGDLISLEAPPRSTDLLAGTKALDAERDERL